MKILFVKEISGAGNHIIDIINDESGNNAPEMLFLQLCENDNMSVKGTLKDGDARQDICLLYMKDFSKKVSATEAGIYVIDSSGLSSIEIALTSGKKVIVKALN